jgi:hypothetical protein
VRQRPSRVLEKIGERGAAGRTSAVNIVEGWG